MNTTHRRARIGSNVIRVSFELPVCKGLPLTLRLMPSTPALTSAETLLTTVKTFTLFHSDDLSAHSTADDGQTDAYWNKVDATSILPTGNIVSCPVIVKRNDIASRWIGTKWSRYH